MHSAYSMCHNNIPVSYDTYYNSYGTSFVTASGYLVSVYYLLSILINMSNFDGTPASLDRKTRE